MTITRIHTPYHDLADAAQGAVIASTAGAPRIPAWAQHRSVYRAGGRTVYIVDTDRAQAARTDLERLEHFGWDVRIDRDPATDHARISLTQREFAKAA